jgi:hypothetical protein
MYGIKFISKERRNYEKEYQIITPSRDGHWCDGWL